MKKTIVNGIAAVSLSAAFGGAHASLLNDDEIIYSAEVFTDDTFQFVPGDPTSEVGVEIDNVSAYEPGNNDVSFGPTLVDYDGLFVQSDDTGDVRLGLLFDTRNSGLDIFIVDRTIKGVNSDGSFNLDANFWGMLGFEDLGWGPGVTGGITGASACAITELFGTCDPLTALLDFTETSVSLTIDEATPYALLPIVAPPGTPPSITSVGRISIDLEVERDTSASVPTPATLALLAIGLVTSGVMRGRKR
jgi:hypothetical protein